jgi:hypothetical protein
MMNGAVSEFGYMPCPQTGRMSLTVTFGDSHVVAVSWMPCGTSEALPSAAALRHLLPPDAKTYKPATASWSGAGGSQATQSPTSNSVKPGAIPSGGAKDWHLYRSRSLAASMDGYWFMDCSGRYLPPGTITTASIGSAGWAVTAGACIATRQ